MLLRLAVALDSMEHCGKDAKRRESLPIFLPWKLVTARFALNDQEDLETHARTLSFLGGEPPARNNWGNGGLCFSLLPVGLWALVHLALSETT